MWATSAATTPSSTTFSSTVVTTPTSEASSTTANSETSTDSSGTSSQSKLFLSALNQYREIAAQGKFVTNYGQSLPPSSTMSSLVRH
ncbi:hypothetical protein OSTOST_25532 [Ostertagia ostertagi]